MTDKARGSVCPVLMLLVFLLGTGLSQDLRRAWGKYVSVDAQLAVALAKQKGLSEQQKDIQKQMGSLKGKQSWFNGWITEIVLARKSAAIVDLADSLQATQQTVADLKDRREEAFLELQKVYQEAATESESENAVSQSDREIVIALARRLVSSPLRSPEFPDYTSFLTREFGDENVRRLVLGDLRSILRGKVVLIDSLLTRRKSEMELFTQLRAFHRDLSLQLESDRDLVPAGKGVMSKSQERSYEDVASTFTPTPDGLESLEPPPRSAIFENQIRPGEEVEFRLGSVTIEEDMLRLQSRRRQYQDLLRRIDKELTD